MDPNFGQAHFDLSQSYAQVGRFEDSLRELEQAGKCSRAAWFWPPARATS